MSAAVQLPLFEAEPLESGLPTSMPRLVPALRKGSVLHPSPLSRDPNALSLNLARGCAHQCAFCSMRVSPSAPQENALYFYTDTCAALERELRARRTKPQSVYLCPSTDPFPPYSAVQEQAVSIVRLLAEQGIQSWIMTRGFIRPFALRAMIPWKNRIRISIGLTTLDRDLQRRLEPHAAPPQLRLRQIKQLRELGFVTQVSLEPLIPGITDTNANLEPMLRSLSEIGVTSVSCSYMFLRDGLKHNLEEALDHDDRCEEALDEYRDGSVLASGGIAPAKYLSRAKRQRGYASVMSLASEYGIQVRIAGATNPDFSTPTIQTRPQETMQPILALFLRNPSLRA